MSDGINHGQTITYCETCRYPVGVCKCDIDISAIPLALCPLCDARVKLIEGFDIDCESTTAVIECTACPLWFGPHYPDNKHDVVIDLHDKGILLKIGKDSSAIEILRVHANSEV